MIELLCRTILVVAIGTAAASKLKNRSEFGTYIAEQTADSIIARVFVPQFLARAIVLFEFILAVYIAIDVGGRSAGVAAYVFLVLATLVLVRQLTRGGATDCACWGARSKSTRFDNPVPIVRRESFSELSRSIMRPAQYGVRNSILALATVLLIIPPGPGALPLVPIALASTPTLIVLFGLSLSFLRERVRLQRTLHPRYFALEPWLAPLAVLSFYTGLTGDDRRSEELNERESPFGGSAKFMP